MSATTRHCGPDIDVDALETQSSTDAARSKRGNHVNIAALAIRFVIAASNLAFATTVRAEVDINAVKFSLGVAQGWRATPDAMNKWCEKVDPEGIASRKTSYQTWLMQYDETIRKIDANFETVVPVVVPTTNPQANMVESVKARIVIETLKTKFLGRSEEEAMLTCKRYAPDTSPATLEKVSKALNQIEAWRREHDVVLKQ